MVSSLFLFTFCLLLLRTDAVPEPYQIPDLSPYGIGITTATVIPIIISNEKPEKLDGNSNAECSQRITADIHQHLDNLGINYKNLSSVLNDQRKFNKMCSGYLTLKQNFNECSKPLGFIYKNGIISFLEIICRIKKESITLNRECIAEMEASAFPSCQQACISQDYKGFDAIADVKNVELRCVLTSCISRCINDQIRECGDSNGLEQLYNEISGTQMLLGVEQIYGSGTKETAKFVSSEKIPASCRRLIWRSVLAAGNFEPRSSSIPSSDSSSQKDITKSF